MDSKVYIKVGEEVVLNYGSGLPARYRRAGKYPVVGSNDVVDTHDEFAVEAPGIVIGRKGSVGALTWLKENFWPIDTTYYVTLKKGGDLKYWYYQLHDLKLNTLNSHAAVPGLNRDDVYRIKVIKRGEKEQKEIAKILGDLDKKIELNRKMNETLEQMGRALFKHYFIDNPESKGWAQKTLSEIAYIVMGQSPESKYYNTEKSGLPFHQGVTNFGLRFPTDSIYSTSGDRKAEKGDVLISVRAPVGRLNIADKQLILGRGVSAIRHKEGKQSYMTYLLKYIFAVEDSMGSGSVFNAITKKELESVKISYDKNTVDAFDDLIYSLDKSISKNSTEISNLVEIRDSILPRLIGGKIIV